MREFYPLIVIGAIIGGFALAFTIAYLTIRGNKEAIGFDRNMKMLFSIAYDIVSPLIIGDIEEVIKGDFELSYLWVRVAVYAAILVVSLVCTYFQSIILQKTGQKIISALREDLFTHIESLSHNQLNSIPVGKLVTRLTNDTNAISMMFTNLIVNLIKNCKKNSNIWLFDQILLFLHALK